MRAASVPVLLSNSMLEKQLPLLRRIALHHLCGTTLMLGTTLTFPCAGLSATASVSGMSTYERDSSSTGCVVPATEVALHLGAAAADQPQQGSVASVPGVKDLVMRAREAAAHSAAASAQEAAAAAAERALMAGGSGESTACDT